MGLFTMAHLVRIYSSRSCESLVARVIPSADMAAARQKTIYTFLTDANLSLKQSCDRHSWTSTPPKTSSRLDVACVPGLTVSYKVTNNLSAPRIPIFGSSTDNLQSFA
jgi:hypothetical protein